MISKHKKLDLEDAEAGMTLSENVFDAKGGVLLPGKTVLTDALLTSLRRRGIDSICVLDDEVSEEELMEERERVRQRLEHLFRKCRNDRTCAVLQQHISAYRLGE